MMAHAHAVAAIAVLFTPTPPTLPPGGSTTVSVAVVWAVGWDGDSPRSYGPKEQPDMSTLTIDGIDYTIASMAL